MNHTTCHPYTGIIFRTFDSFQLLHSSWTVGSSSTLAGQPPLSFARSMLSIKLHLHLWRRKYLWSFNHNIMNNYHLFQDCHSLQRSLQTRFRQMKIDQPISEIRFVNRDIAQASQLNFFRNSQKVIKALLSLTDIQPGRLQCNKRHSIGSSIRSCISCVLLQSSAKSLLPIPCRPMTFETRVDCPPRNPFLVNIPDQL